MLVLVIGLIPGAVFAGPFIAEDASEDAFIAEDTGKDAVILEDAGKDIVIAEETGGDHAAVSDTDEEAAADDIREYPLTDSDPAEQSHIHDDVTYMKWTATDSLPASGSYYLDDDVRITRVFTVSGKLDLCLNGYKIIWAGQNDSSPVICVDEGAELSILDCSNSKGGLITSDRKDGSLIENFGTLTIDGARIQAKYDTVKSSGSLTIRNGARIIAADYNAILVRAGSSLEVSGEETFLQADINTISYEADMQTGASVTIRGGTVESAHQAAILMPSASKGTLTIEDGNIRAHGSYSLLQAASEVDIRITGGTLDSTIKSTGAPHTKKLSISGDALVESLSLEDYESDLISITGGRYKDGIYVTDPEGNSLKCFAGGIFGNGFREYPGNLPQLIKDGYCCMKNTDSSTRRDYCYRIAPVGSNEARIGFLHYPTLIEAISDASADNTVTLLKDIELTGDDRVDGDLTIDMNGKTITGVDRTIFRIRQGNVNITGTGTIRTVVSENTNLNKWSSMFTVGADWKSCKRRVKLTIGDYVTVSTDYCNAFALYGYNNDGNDETADIELVVKGTIKANGGIEVKTGDVTIDYHAQITSTAQTQAYRKESYGASTAGYAIAAVSNSEYAAVPNVYICSDDITGLVTMLKDDDSSALGIVRTSPGLFAERIETTSGHGWEIQADNSFILVDGVVAGVGGKNYPTLSDALNAAYASEDNAPRVTLLDDIALSEQIAITGSIFLVLNGKTITNTDSWDDSEGSQSRSLISIQGAHTEVEISDYDSGTVGSIQVKGKDAYAIDIRDGAELTIRRGRFIGNTCIVYVIKGQLFVYGGYFEVRPKSGTDKPYEYTLDCDNENHKEGEAIVSIAGGLFYRFDPQDNRAEGEDTEFTADDFVSIPTEDNLYKVEKGGTVEFDSAGGSFVEEQRIAFGCLAEKPEDPTYEGYVFLGWFNGEDTDPFDFANTAVTEDITLTAKWAEREKITSLTLKYASLVYTGKARTQTASAVVKAGDKVLKRNTDYTVRYKNNNKVGTASMIVEGIGAYKGTLKKTFKIVPKGTKLKTPAAGRRSITVKWNKQTAQTTGYQIQYSTSPTFASGNKTVRIKASKTTSKKISGLKDRKK